MSSSDARSDFKSQVLQTTDIVELIGRTVALKRAGKDYKGLCPFHTEKSPSFTVSPTKQFFYCYGCKASGNAIDFVIKRDKVEFIDALKFLAEQAGLEMPRYGVSKEKLSERQALLEAHSAACAFFEKWLSDSEPGKAALGYLEKRGIDAGSVRRFQIGMAPDLWDGLLKGIGGRKFPPDLLHRGGLVKKREKGDGYYDTFRNRLMFPIKDADGRVIAFGGRKMPDSQDPAKYLNSPETPLFFKGRSVFGIHLARQKIVESRTVVVVEGYTDVVMAHQFGVSNVVSVLGTAMTEQHVALLRRYLPEDGGRIVLLFDADSAGDAAVDRTVGLFLTQPVEIAIASMPEGMDPDEFLLKEGAEAFDKLVAGAQDALTYKWKRLVRKLTAGGDDLTGEQKAVEAYLQVLASARGSGPVDGLRWGAALSRVSRLTGIPVEQLNRRFRNVPSPARPGPAPASANAAGDGTSAESGSGTGADGRRAPRRQLTAQDRAERWILGSLLLNPPLWTKLQRVVGVVDFTDPVARRLAEMYWGYQRDEGEPVFNEFLGLVGNSDRGGHSSLQEYAVEAVDEVETLASTPGADPEETLAAAVAHLERSRKHREQQKLFAELRRTDTTADGNASPSRTSEQNEQHEIDQLRRLQEMARRPDLRRS